MGSISLSKFLLGRRPTTATAQYLQASFYAFFFVIENKNKIAFENRNQTHPEFQLGATFHD